MPSFPKIPLVLALGALLGIGAGIAAAVATELAFAGLTADDDVERLGIPFLGGVPEFKSVKPRGKTPVETVRDMPRSAYSEYVRGILVKLRQTEGRGQVVLLTSALPNEGKTTVVACLAQSAARAGERVIVIDCDSARHQYSATYVKPKPKQPGLREVLNGDVTIAAAIVQDEASGISSLPITSSFDDKDPHVNAAKLTALIGQLREHFHLILLDSAPLLPVAETREYAAIADKVILVAQWRRTSEYALRTALELLPSNLQGNVALVLSRIDMKRQSRFSRQGAGAFYKSYKGYYHA